MTSKYEDLAYRMECGMEHCFIDWSHWEEIDDEKFHELRLKYINAREELYSYALHLVNKHSE